MQRVEQLAAATICALWMAGCATPAGPLDKSYVFVDASFRQTRNHIMNPRSCRATFDDIAGAWAAVHKLTGSGDHAVPVEKGGRVSYPAENSHGAIAVDYRLLHLDEPTVRVELHVEIGDAQGADQGAGAVETLRVNELLAELKQALAGC
jgi:hypothetical protein